jgi:hypothetical protein
VLDQGKKSSLQPQPWKKSLGIMKKKAGFVVPRSYIVEILVGDEVEAVEAVGKIFLEEVKVSLSQLYNLLLYNP